MLRGAIAYLRLNIKSLLKDKISFVWSIVFPLVMFGLNHDSISQDQLIYWWEYMIVCSFVYGIGIYAVELRDNGCLRTLFSINSSRKIFLLGNLLTQILFCIITIGVFNLIVTITKGYDYFSMILLALLLVLLNIPIALGCLFLSLPRRISIESIKTIFTIFITLMFFCSQSEHYGKYTILSMFYNLIYLTNPHIILVYLILSIMLTIIGVYSLSRLSAVSEVRR